ncbi:hypothetical protein Tco_0747497 [Tanacetum coccineum]|uniref:Reverse transcriptase domain-containing protein n=1 Tax=Tanacetum coccineum TaxID=301880 RepID=A0ABQ4YVE9_9ASTR
MMTERYCLRGEIKKLEVEMWNIKVKGTDVVSYNQRFQELALLCARMFPEESDKIERYVSGFPDMIHGSMMASKPKTMHDVIEFATELMDKKISTFAERQSENKRKQMITNNNNKHEAEQLQSLMLAGSSVANDRNFVTAAKGQNREVFEELIKLKALIDQGVADALAARDADRNRNGEDSHDSGTGVRRPATLTRKYTYPDFMK